MGKGNLVTNARFGQALHVSLLSLVIFHEAAIHTAANQPITRFRGPGKFPILLLPAHLITVDFKFRVLLVGLVCKTFDLERGKGIGIGPFMLVNQLTDEIELVVQLVLIRCLLKGLLVCFHSSDLGALQISALTSDGRGGTGAKD